MKCSRCGREITEDQAYAYQGKPICDDCLMDVGLTGKQCDPWASYVDSKSSQGVKGAVSLSGVQQQIYDLVKSQGRATREEVMERLKLSDSDLKAQLTTLMHSELVKERSEGGKFYLIPIK